jgi:gamma-glutamyltranspeptidase/glutathione hydrolase/leukotriene-C4 hydrolase
LLHNPDWSHIFAPNGILLKEGDTIQRVNLSRTLSLIAERGPGAFYHGEIADAIISKIRAEGGIVTHDDLVNYEVKVSRALEGTYRGRKVYTTHAPSSGPVLLHMLNLMEKYDLPAEGRTDVNVHRLVEATKCKHILLNELSVTSDLLNNSWLCCTVRYYPVAKHLIESSY